MRKLLLLALLGIGGFAGPSSAETVTEIAVRWGIVGTWQQDCRAPVSHDNDRQVFVIRGGRLVLDRFYGDTSDSNPVTAASINDQGELDLRIEFPVYHQVRQNVHALGRDGRDHIVLNRDVFTGTYTVRDGILISTGKPTPWMTRCGTGPSS
jgi:hypothetical protein